MFKEFLRELDKRAIKISYSDGKLRYKGPDHSLDAEMLENIRKNKAKLIKYLWPQECRNMIPINTEGRQVPFILLHGSRVNYLLSNYLGGDQPFYGFFHNGSQGEKITHKTVESLAAYYVSQLKKILPEGPYRLGGLSFGGLLAYEMAIQLQEQGHDLQVLFLVDSIFPFSQIPGGQNILTRLGHKIYQALRHFYYLAKKKYFETILFFLGRLPASLRSNYIITNYFLLSRKYKTSSIFKGEIVLLKASQNKSVNESLGWNTVCDKLKIIVVEGDHISIGREENYLILGKHIQEMLNNARLDKHSSNTLEI